MDNDRTDATLWCVWCYDRRHARMDLSRYGVYWNYRCAIVTLCNVRYMINEIFGYCAVINYWSSAIDLSHELSWLHLHRIQLTGSAVCLSNIYSKMLVCRAAKYTDVVHFLWHLNIKWASPKLFIHPRSSRCGSINCVYWLGSQITMKEK